MGRIISQEHGQYWAVFIPDGLMGFAYAHSPREAKEIAFLMLMALDVQPMAIFTYPIGPRLFATEGIETGDC
jgi:hypothetical protein